MKRPADFADPYYTPPEDVLQSLGYITVVSAGIEDLIHGLFWRCAGLSDERGTIITRDMKPYRMIDDIVRLALVRKWPDKQIADLKDIFSDLKKLVEKRNQCIHWLWDKTQTNEHRIYTPAYKAERKTISYTSEDLQALAEDLAWIEVRLDSHYLTPSALTKKRKGLGADKDLYAPAPWL